MKITLIIIQSIDGYIARGQDDDLSWGSKEDKMWFRQKTKEIGTMIMGSRTFENMLKVAPIEAFTDRNSLVLTSNPGKYKDHGITSGKVEFFSGPPADIIKHLENRGIKHAALIGGGNLNGQFLEADLIDEMYITIAPYVFGGGVRGFGKYKQIGKFKLKDIKQLNKEAFLYFIR